MFTGIVEGLGIISETEAEGAGRRIVVEAPAEVTDGRCSIGDSISINGCCLTVVAVNGLFWSFQAGAETLAKTNLGELTVGGPVNLERALAVNGRLGGHIVQGHVDGTGIIDAIDRDGEWTMMWFRIPAELAEQMVPKGSVAVDGVSLTVVNVERERFSVALIPHTLDVTTIGKRRTGDSVNIEVDILGKYVRKFLDAWRPEPATPK